MNIHVVLLDLQMIVGFPVSINKVYMSHAKLARPQKLHNKLAPVKLSFKLEQILIVSDALIHLVF